MSRITDWSIIAKKDRAMVEMFIADAKDYIMQYDDYSNAKAAKEAILTYEEFIPRDISRLALRKLVISHLEQPRPMGEQIEGTEGPVAGTLEDWEAFISEVD